MYRDFIKSDNKNVSLLKKLIFKSYIKSVISFTLAKLHLDSLMIARRNQKNVDVKYQIVLDVILKI